MSNKSTFSLKVGDVISHPDFKNRERYTWFNEVLNKLELCPKRPLQVYSEEAFESCFSIGREIFELASDEEFHVISVNSKAKEIKAKGLESGHIIQIDMDMFPNLVAIRNDMLPEVKNKSKKKASTMEGLLNGVNITYQINLDTYAGLKRIEAIGRGR